MYLSSFLRAVLAVLLAVVMATNQAGAQQTAGVWSAPSLVDRTSGELASSTIVLLADPLGQLHALYTERPDADASLALTYATWDGGRWLEPIDVLVDDKGGNMAYLQGVLDSRQVLHVIWAGAGNVLRYSSVPLLSAASTNNWSSPVTLATSIGGGDIIVGSDDTISIAHVTTTDSSSISFIQSHDGGFSWSSPRAIASGEPGSFPSGVSLALDDSGRFHAAWTEMALPQGWPPTGAFYTRSTDGGEIWETPQRIAGTDHGQIGVATVGANEIHLVWRSTIGGDGTFHQLSNDGGQTWLTRNISDDKGGFSGSPAFAVDSKGGLHYVIGSAFTSSWQDGVLAPYLDVAGSDLRTGAGQEPGWTHPERAVMAITMGHRVHVLFETGLRELWHTTIVTDAPATSVAIPPPVVETTTVARTESPASAVRDTPTPAPERQPNLNPSRERPSSPLLPFLGTGLVALFLAGFVIATARRRR